MNIKDNIYSSWVIIADIWVQKLKVKDLLWIFT